MKETTKFNKQSVYSDVPQDRNDATFFKYIGEEKEGIYFREIGGNDDSYITLNHPKYGLVVSFSSLSTELFELTDKQVQKLIKQGKITEQ